MVPNSTTNNSGFLKHFLYKVVRHVAFILVPSLPPAYLYRNQSSLDKRSAEVFRGGCDSFTRLLIIMDLRSIFHVLFRKLSYRDCQSRKKRFSA